MRAAARKGAAKPEKRAKSGRGANLEPPIKPGICWVSQLPRGSGIKGEMVRLPQDTCALYSQASPIFLRALTAVIVLGEREQRTPRKLDCIAPATRRRPDSEPS